MSNNPTETEALREALEAGATALQERGEFHVYRDGKIYTRAQCAEMARRLLAFTPSSTAQRVCEPAYCFEKANGGVKCVQYCGAVCCTRGYPASPPCEPAVSDERLAELDAAISAELERVSHIPYDSHEICKHFASKVRERLRGKGRV